LPTVIWVVLPVLVLRSTSKYGRSNVADGVSWMASRSLAPMGNRLL
jgi:hypothetical protein